MTKKDYEKLARALADGHCAMVRKLQARRGNPDLPVEAKQALIRTTDVFVMAMSTQLQLDNPNFNKHTFLDAVIRGIPKEYLP